MYSYCYRIRANRALNVLAQNITVNCTLIVLEVLICWLRVVGVFTLRGVIKPTMDHVNYFTIAKKPCQKESSAHRLAFSCYKLS